MTTNGTSALPLMQVNLNDIKEHSDLEVIELSTIISALRQKQNMRKYQTKRNAFNTKLQKLMAKDPRYKALFDEVESTLQADES